MNRLKRYPNWVVLVHTKTEACSWLGTAYYFFDKEEDAQSFYEEMSKQNKAIVKRPFVLSNDLKYLNVIQRSIE